MEYASANQAPWPPHFSPAPNPAEDWSLKMSRQFDAWPLWVKAKRGRGTKAAVTYHPGAVSPLAGGLGMSGQGLDDIQVSSLIRVGSAMCPVHLFSPNLPGMHWESLHKALWPFWVGSLLLPCAWRWRERQALKGTPHGPLAPTHIWQLPQASSGAGLQWPACQEFNIQGTEVLLFLLIPS